MAPFPIQISTFNVDKAFQEAGKPSQPDLVQSSEPRLQGFGATETEVFPSAWPRLPQIHLQAAPGAGNAARGWAMVGAASPPPPPAARGALWRLASAPASRRVGCARPRPTPAPPARRARRGPRDAGSGPSPRFRGPGPARCVAGVLGPGPRSAHCARKSTYFAPSPGSSRPRCSRSWPQTGGRGGSPAGRGARARGARVYMVQGLFLLFFHPPSLPSPNSARRGGRMYSERHFRCLEGAGPARPHQPGFAAAAPGGRSRPIPALGPRGLPGVRTAHTRWGGRGQRGTRPRNPPGCSSRRPARTPEGWAGALGTPHPGSGAFAPAALGVWAPPSPGSRVAPVVCRRGASRAAVGWVLAGGRGGGAVTGLAGGERRLGASAERWASPLPSSEIKRPVLTCLRGNWDRSLGQEP